MSCNKVSSAFFTKVASMSRVVMGSDDSMYHGGRDNYSILPEPQLIFKKEGFGEVGFAEEGISGIGINNLRSQRSDQGGL
jgi:hypothetical protein